ncbi:MAG: DUF4238 domain-containing protein [Microbacteriaceae bacterium]|nr:MAG: DUF4238 domain-containing protein [Microbacteriaceae bacterium]
MSQARRHHYVSQFYLRAFASDRSKPRLFVVNLDRGSSFTTSPANVALENDFHTITAPDQPPDAVERVLSTLESEVAPALARVIESASFANEEDQGLILFFTTLLFVKNPQMRAVMDKVANALMSLVAKSHASNKAAWDEEMRLKQADGIMPQELDSEALRQSILNDEYTVSLTPEAHMQSEFGMAQPLLPHLTARKWNIYKATAGHFITCDRPVALIWADPSETGPIGLGLPNTRVLFPLSSHVAISGGFELKNATVEVGAVDVAKINGRIILNANHQVYARDDQFEYLLPHNSHVMRGSDLSNDEVAKARGANKKIDRTGQ